jgi:uncharacterized iron-regulated protein
MKVKITLLILSVILLAGFKSDKQAYQFFNAKGSKVKYKAVVKAVNESDIIFFGELHNNPICHWLQYELTKDLYGEKKELLMIGAEMFEADNQLILDEYLQGKIKEKSFESECRLWSNYKTDYKPLVNFAKENEIPFIATNIPRRYASLVHKKGFEGLEELSGEAKQYFPPPPIPYDPELKGYKDMLEMMGGMGGHANENLPKAQAIKDATMAYHILKHWSQGKSFIHYNGTYHSNNFEGIIWYLKQENPDLKIVTIASVEQDTIDSLIEENLNLADFILCIPENMTKTY